MPNWLADPPRSLYIVLIAGVLLPLLAVFFLRPQDNKKRDPKQKQKSPKTLLLGISAVILIVLVALKISDHFFESDSEQIERKLKEMSDGVRDRDLNLVFSHISEKFRYSSADKKSLRALADRAQQAGQVDRVPIWDIKVDPIPSGADKATVVFRFKVIGNALQENQFLCRAYFVRDPDGQWRLQEFEVFPPTDLKNQYPVPGLQ